MPSFSTRKRLPYTPRQMFDLVADVEQYPRFLPLCTGLIVRRREHAEDKDVLIADMAVGYRAIRESFTTRVTLLPAAPEILVEYLDGPFHHLENRWRFLPAGEGCDVDFFIDYSFRSPVLALLVGAVFDKAFRRFTDAFEARAREVYGPPRAPGQPAATTPEPANGRPAHRA